MQEKEFDSAGDFEEALSRLGKGRYVLRLYVTGSTSRSLQAITSIRNICETHLKGRFELEVIDTYKSPSMARQDQIVALPTLVKQLPPPIKRIIGDLTDTEKVLVGLDLIERELEGGDGRH